jgi:hypothetical protein
MISSDSWPEWWFHLPPLEVLPVDAREKWMLFYLMTSVVPQTLFRLFREKTLNKRTSLIRERRLHFDFVLQDHLELLKFILVSHFEGINT